MKHVSSYKESNDVTTPVRGSSAVKSIALCRRKEVEEEAGIVRACVICARLARDWSELAPVYQNLWKEAVDGLYQLKLRNVLEE